jgi:nitrate/nitrite transporter NarK
MLSIVQTAGVVGRVVWGWLGDMTGDSLRLLVMLGMVTVACCFLMTWVTPEWPMPLLGVFLTVFGGTAIGWNGLFLAEIARRSPQGQVGQATGAAVVWNFAGILIGPALFGAVYRSIGSYSVTYGLLSVIATGALALLIASWRAARAEDARQLAGSPG